MLSKEMQQKVGDTLADSLHNEEVLLLMFDGRYQDNNLFCEPQKGDTDNILRCRMRLLVSPPDDPADAQFPIILPIDNKGNSLLIGHVEVKEITLYDDEADYHKAHADFLATHNPDYTVGPAEDFLNALIPPQKE